MSRIVCTECGTRLPANAEVCSECAYPVTSQALKAPEESAELHRTELKEYKLIQLLGGVVVCAGIVAAVADSHLAAAISITIGIATYLTGLLGAWWNTGS